MSAVRSTAERPTPPPARPAVARLGLLVATAVGLRLADRGTLRRPPLGVEEVAGWVGESDPGQAAMVVVRTGAECATWYLLVVALLAVLGDRGGASAVLTRITSSGTRRLVAGILGTSMVTAAAVPAAGAESPPTDGPGVATMVPIDNHLPASAEDGDEGSAGDARGENGSAWMTPVDQLPDLPAEPAAPDGDLPSAESIDLEAPAAPAAPASTWTVDAGESLWSIARDTVAPTGDEVTAEVDGYWRALIELNRDRLVDPDDPDLILPGQVFELPLRPTGGPAAPGR